MKDSKQEAMEKQHQGQEHFRKSNFSAAIIKFSEGKLLLPQLNMYAEEMKQFCWWLAECHLRKVQSQERLALLSLQVVLKKGGRGMKLCTARLSVCGV